MRYAVGCDHAGLPLKEPLLHELRRQGHEVTDFGTHSPQSCHYPEFAVAVGWAVANGQADFGLLVCGTGLGMALAADKLPGVRAVTANSTFLAEMARRHNDANILCLGARVLDAGQAREVLRAWHEAGFEGGRHQLRLDMIAQAEERRGDDARTVREQT